MRPYLLTDTVRRRFLDALQAGTTVSAAAQMCGIGRSTLYDWMRAAEKDDAPPALKQFAQDVEVAKARAQVSLEMMVRKHAEKHPKAAQWMLERRFPKDWGKRDPAREEQNERALLEIRKLFKVALASGIFSGAVVLEQELEAPQLAEPTPEAQSAASSSEPAP